jgi:hypothetical protein
MNRIKKARTGMGPGDGILKALGKTARKAASSNVKKVKIASSKGLSKSDFGEFSDQFIGRKPSSTNVKKAIAFDYTGKKQKYKTGGMAKAKSGKKFPDLTGDGKVTKADVLKGRGVIKNGGNLKKAFNGTTTVAQRASRAARPMPSPASDRRKSRAASALNPTMKNGGKSKKMMGGKCKYGC